MIHGCDQWVGFYQWKRESKRLQQRNVGEVNLPNKELNQILSTRKMRYNLWDEEKENCLQ